MDSITLSKICLNNSILKPGFLGILRLKDLISGKVCLSGMRKIGDFAVVNVRNSHWLTLLWGNENEMYVFDSLGGIVKN